MKRGQISLGGLALPFTCITLILTMLIYCEIAVANLLFETPCGVNKAYRQNATGNAKTGTSRIECGLLCETNDACNSFTYNRSSGLCQLSTGLGKNCNLLTTEKDSMYYVVVSNATPYVPLIDEMVTSVYTVVVGELLRIYVLRIKLITDFRSICHCLYAISINITVFSKSDMLCNFRPP